MKRIAILCCLLSAACTANGAPTVATDPPSYLAGFPLGARPDYVVGIMGAPDSRVPISDREIWSYRMGRGLGLRRWSFVFEDGQVQDVIYNDQGPCNGITARQMQSGAAIC